MRLAQTHTFSKLILVAGWDFNDLTPEHRLYWQTPMDHKAIRQHVKDIYVISSDNDPYVTAATAEDMSKRLSGNFILVKRAGHFTKQFGISQIPQILKLL
jgi:predicted alpha/beta hydrolase family esterase